MIFKVIDNTVGEFCETTNGHKALGMLSVREKAGHQVEMALNDDKVDKKTFVRAAMIFYSK